MDARLNIKAALGLALVCWGAGVVRAEDQNRKFTLRAEPQAGQVSRVEVQFKVGGDLKLVSEGKSQSLTMNVNATHAYDEQLLAIDGAKPRRAVRFYDEAQASILIDKGQENPKLDPVHRLIVVDKSEPKNPAVLFSPQTALKRDELDLLELPGTSLAADQLLPADPVALGGSWKLPDDVLADLLLLEAISWTDVQSMLTQVADDVAEIDAAGSVSGAIGGVGTEIELKARYRFDMKAKRVTYVALLIKEKRAIGHVGPGLATVAKLLMKITPLEKSEHLDEKTVELARAAQSDQQARLAYTSPAATFRFAHDRRWYLTSEDKKLSIFRFLDRGELVAQCNVSALPPVPEKPVTLAQFQHDIETSLGKTFGRFVHASQFTNDNGYSVLRVVAAGTVSQLPIQWVYYLISDDKGGRVSLAFTLEETLENRFAGADRLLANAVRIAPAATPKVAKPSGNPVKPAPTASKPTQQK